jgi:hypothetical protein
VSNLYLRNITPDLTVSGALFNYQLLEATGTAATVATGNLSAGTTFSIYAFTNAGFPGVQGSAGDYSAKFNVTSGSTNIQLSVVLARVNSSGTVQASSSASAEQVASAGVKTFSFSSPSLGTWAAGDRLRIQYRLRNTQAHGNTSISFGANTTNEEVVTPWTIAETSRLKYFDGTEFVSGTLKYYDGAAFITGVLKRYDGATWVET